MAEHEKIITNLAKQFLKPQGIVQKGQSRTWYDDQGFYMTVIEFQPHKIEPGAFLNIGVNFHWYVKEYISFDIGYRESKFEKFKTADQFTAKIEEMVNLAKDKALLFRERFSDLSLAKKNILAHDFGGDVLWGNYHKGIICGLTQDLPGLHKYFEALLQVDHNVGWANDLKSTTIRLKEIALNYDLFRAEVIKFIEESRRLKKLKPMEIGSLIKS